VEKYGTNDDGELMFESYVMMLEAIVCMLVSPSNSKKQYLGDVRAIRLS
jgi:hypothetical protein